MKHYLVFAVIGVVLFLTLGVTGDPVGAIVLGALFGMGVLYLIHYSSEFRAHLKEKNARNRR